MERYRFSMYDQTRQTKQYGGYTPLHSVKLGANDVLGRGKLCEVSASCAHLESKGTVFHSRVGKRSPSIPRGIEGDRFPLRSGKRSPSIPGGHMRLTLHRACRGPGRR